jgi:hypothetical protein
MPAVLNDTANTPCPMTASDDHFIGIAAAAAFNASSVASAPSKSTP